MGLFTGCIDKLIGAFIDSGYVKGVAVVLRNADDTHDVQQGDGLGGAKVSLSSASTAALASQTTLAAVSAALAFPLHTAITPHDTNSVVATASKGIYVYGAGNLVYKTVGGATIGPVAVAAGTYIPGQFALVLATSSTVTNVVGLS